MSDPLEPGPSDGRERRERGTSSLFGDFHSLEGACQLAARVRLFRISKAVGYYPALHKD